jgi:iron complex transport system ATP-binding protein
MISIRDLSYRVGSNEILRDLSLDVPRGKVTALIGPNGAGKSTLLSLIARLVPLQTGTIHVGDLQIGSCSNRALARHLSILPQMPDQVPRLRVRELVEFGRFPYHQGRPDAEDATKVEQALDIFGLQQFEDRSIDEI